MSEPLKDSIPDLLLRNIPREIVMGIEDALTAGAHRAYAAAHGMEEGHLPSALGQLRHFHMNESFHRALELGNASPSVIRGNKIVTGRTGIFTLSRFNISAGFWTNGRRSSTRKQMSAANKAIEPLVQPELFSGYQPPSDVVAFFVACFSGSMQNQPEAPVTVQIAVPDRDMRGWLFREEVGAFSKRYEQQDATQGDLVIPKLKKNIGKQEKDGTTK